jgi:adenine/guanine phosphoribosyltransferase-like PRPP-binding protein
MTRGIDSGRIEATDRFIGIEQDLRSSFIREAMTRRDPQSGKIYISVPFVNQYLDPIEFGKAAELIAEQYRRLGKTFDVVTGIQYSGISLAFKVAEELGLHLAPSRKEDKMPDSWRETAFKVSGVHSYTTEDDYTHVFNRLKPGNRVLVVDDVIATGDASVPILRRMQDAGMQVEKAAFWVKQFDQGIDRLRGIGVEPVYAVGVKEVIQDPSGALKPVLAPPQFS